ncbi:MAG: radical SAM protein [Anaerolineales bacterium]
MTPGPLTVVWRITTACDLACPFCGYSRELRWPRTHASRDDVLAFGAALGEYAALTGRDVHVSVLGGEPLLWPPLAEVSRILVAYGLSLGVTTNGTHLIAALDVLQHFNRVTLSLDGLRDFHDCGRGRRGLFDAVCSGITELKQRMPAGGVICVNTVLMRSNLHRFGELLATLAGWGVDEVTFNALGGFDRPGEFYECEKLLPEHIAWLRAELPELRQLVAPMVVRGSDRYLGRMMALARNLPIAIEDCAPGESFLFVDERGYVSPCSFTPREYGFHISKFRTAADLAHLPERFRARRQHHRAAACDDCRSTQLFGKFALGDVPQLSRGTPI